MHFAILCFINTALSALGRFLSKYAVMTEQPRPNHPHTMPPLDIARLTQTYQDITTHQKTVKTDKVLTDIYGMLLHIITKSEKQEGNHSARCGLAIRNLPKPGHGFSDTDNVVEVLEEIAGQKMSLEILKVVRKGHERDGCLGTVLVSMRTEEMRRRIMKRKECLRRSKNKIWRNVIIKNMRRI